eukprot:6250523-Pyramimonas_sp.AAC.1
MHLITGGDLGRWARIPDARPTIHLIISNILSKGGGPLMPKHLGMGNTRRLSEAEQRLDARLATAGSPSRKVPPALSHRLLPQAVGIGSKPTHDKID